MRKEERSEEEGEPLSRSGVELPVDQAHEKVQINLGDSTDREGLLGRLFQLMKVSEEVRTWRNGRRTN